VFSFYPDKKSIALRASEGTNVVFLDTLFLASFNFKEFYGLHAKEDIMNLPLGRRTARAGSVLLAIIDAGTISIDRATDVYKPGVNPR